MMKKFNPWFALMLALPMPFAHAEIFPQAEVGIKITLAKKPTSRPQTIAFVPATKTYYIADGGLAPMASEFEAAISKSQIHAYSQDGKYINSAQPGYDNRSIYFNSKTNHLETITYNVSTDVGFTPSTGIYAIDTAENGEVKSTSTEIIQSNPAFGSASTMPSFDPATGLYYAKQARGNKVWVVDIKAREKQSEIALDFVKAGVAHDDVGDSFIAYTGVKNEEFLLIDVDHKAILAFDLTGQYLGKSELPKELKLRSNNHFNGTGFANQMFFVYNETEGEFGTYYGFKVFK